MLHHQLLIWAQYCAWANDRLHETAASWSADEFRTPPPAAVASLLGLLNGLLVSGRLLLARLRGYDPGIESLGEQLHDELDTLREAQVADDVELCGYLHGLGAEDLPRPVSYRDLDGTAHTSSQQELLVELFVLQTHMRGRICELLSNLDIQPPSLDYIEFLRESGK